MGAALLAALPQSTEFQVWRTDGVIASLAFHPVDRLLVVAAFDDLLFWDWSLSEPFARVKTRNEEKVSM